MKIIRIVCANKMAPSGYSIVEFYMNDDIDTHKTNDCFSNLLAKYDLPYEDQVRNAACAFSNQHYARFEMYNADLIIHKHEVDCCTKCGTKVRDGDCTSALYNEGFSDEGLLCWDCYVYEFENNGITRCESCQNVFKHDHLIRNKDSDEEVVEICPYCGQIYDD